MVLQWESDPSVVEDTWLSQDSSAGQRALRLGGEGRWLHVPASGLSQSTGKQASCHLGDKQVVSAAALCPRTTFNSVRQAGVQWISVQLTA